MVGDGILPGDKVLLRPGIEVRNGEIAAVQIAGTEGFEDGSVCATLKHVYLNEGAQCITLRASNPRHADREVEAARVSIAGVYRGLVRLME
jgi:SOS-response transcriptional repressor LexA